MKIIFGFTKTPKISIALTLTDVLRLIIIIKFDVIITKNNLLKISFHTQYFQHTTIVITSLTLVMSLRTDYMQSIPIFFFSGLVPS